MQEERRKWELKYYELCANWVCDCSKIIKKEAVACEIFVKPHKVVWTATL